MAAGELTDEEVFRGTAPQDVFRVPSNVQRERDLRSLQLKEEELQGPDANPALAREIENDRRRLGIQGPPVEIPESAVYGSQQELTEEEVFGAKPKEGELSDAEVFKTQRPATALETARTLPGKFGAGAFEAFVANPAAMAYPPSDPASQAAAQQQLGAIGAAQPDETGRPSLIQQAVRDVATGTPAPVTAPEAAAGRQRAIGLRESLAEAERELLPPEAQPGLVGEAAMSAVRSAPSTLLGFATGRAGPLVGAAGGAASTFQNTFEEAYKKTGDSNLAGRAAAIDMMLEFGGEKIGFDAILKGTGTAVTRLLKAAGIEGGQELVTQIGQDINAMLHHEPELTAKEALHRAKVAALAGAMSGGAFSGALQLKEKAEQKVQQALAPTIPDMIGAGKIDEAVQLAQTPQPDQLPPIIQAKRAFDAGKITGEQFIEFQRGLVNRTLAMEPSTEVAEAAARRKAAEETILAPGDSYNPTQAEVAQLERAREVVEKSKTSATVALVDLMNDAKTGDVLAGNAVRLWEGKDLDEFEIFRKQKFAYENQNLSPEQRIGQWALKEYLESAQRQSEGLFPFAPLDSYIVEDPRGGRTVEVKEGDVITPKFLRDIKPGEVFVEVNPSIMDVPRNIARVATDWVQEQVRKFAPDMSVLIAQEPRPISRGGHMHTYDGGLYKLNVDWGLPDAAQAEVLAHEFGHALGYHLLKKSSPQVRDAVLRAYSAEQGKLYRDKVTAKEFYRRNYGPVTAEHFGIGSKPVDFARESRYRSYHTNADEWLAHQTERAAAKDFLGMGAKLKGFFIKYAETLKRVFTNYQEKFDPSAKWQEWMNFHKLRIEEQKAQSERAARIVTRMHQQGFELNSEQMALMDQALSQELQAIDADAELHNAVMAASAKTRQEIHQSIQELGVREAAVLAPAMGGLQPSAEEFAEALSTNVIPGQRPNELAEGLDKSARSAKPFNPVMPSSLGSNVGQAIRRMLGPTPPPDQYQSHLDRFGWFTKMTHTLEQLGYRHKHLEQLQRYISTVRSWAKTRSEWLSKADARLKQWYGLNKKEREGLARLLQDQTLEEKFFNLTDPALIGKYNITPRMLEVYQGIRGDFSQFILSVENALYSRAQQQLAANPIALAQERARIKEKFDSIRDKPYFPLMRFGDHVVLLHAERDGQFFGKQYKAGELVYRAHYFLKKQAEAAAKDLARSTPGIRVKLDKQAEGGRQFSSMPWQVLDALKSDPNINLSPDQTRALDQFMYKLAPGQSFVKRLMARRGIAGFSEDAMRTYANYFFHGAGHIARIQHGTALADATSAVRATADAIPADARKRRDIANYVQGHFDELMNPEADWANLRGIVAVSYLGYSLTTALVNLTQVPMVTYPHLAGLYGDAKAIRAITGATTQLGAAFGAKKILTQAEQAAATKWAQGLPLTPQEAQVVRKLTGLTPDQFRMLQQGQAETWLDESQATELAAQAEGGWLTRFKATSELGYIARTIAHYGMVPFQFAEQANRRVTALARYNLAREAGDTHEQAVEAARESVSRTQFEYSKWNRPNALRGKKGLFLMFMQYQLNMLYFAMGGDKGWWRWWLMMLAAVGPMGLPFAENLADLATWLLSRENERKSVRYDMRKYAEELGEAVGLAPDTLMHGLSRTGFGTMIFDLSGNMGMGRVIPGTDLLIQTGDPDKLLSRSVAEAGGATTALLMRMLQAAADPSLSGYERLEKAMPFSAVQRAMQAGRWYSRGAEENKRGADIVKFDTNDPWELAEIAGRAVLGTMPRRVSEAREELRTRQDISNFYRTRRQLLLDKLDHEREHGTGADVQEVMAAVRKYNDEVPVVGLRITGRQISESYRAREKARTRQERGLGATRQEEMIERAIRERQY